MKSLACSYRNEKPTTLRKWKVSIFVKMKFISWNTKKIKNLKQLPFRHSFIVHFQKISDFGYKMLVCKKTFATIFEKFHVLWKNFVKFHNLWKIAHELEYHLHVKRISDMSLSCWHTIIVIQTLIERVVESNLIFWILNSA